MENLNGNLILCQNFDKDNGNITGIFNTITLNDDQRQSFDLVMFFSGVEYPPKAMIVYYLIYRVQEFKENEANSAKILSKSILRRVSGSQRIDGKGRECSFSDAFASSIKVEIKKLKFTKTGVYEIRAYVFPYEKEMPDFSVTDILNHKEAFLCLGNFEVREKTI